MDINNGGELLTLIIQKVSKAGLDFQSKLYTENHENVRTAADFFNNNFYSIDRINRLTEVTDQAIVSSSVEVGVGLSLS